MAEQDKVHIIHALADKWSRNNRTASLLKALAAACLPAAVAFYVFQLPVWIVILLFIVITALCCWLLRPARPLSPTDISSYLNRTHPELEESTQLLLLPEQSLTLLQRMQVEKIAPSLNQLPPPPEMQQPLRKALFVLSGAVLASLFVYLGSRFVGHNGQQEAEKIAAAASTKPETVLPGIASFHIQITPPAYTRNKSRQQQQFMLKVEEGSQVQWEIHTNQKVPQLQLVFNTRDTLPFAPAAQDSTIWTLQREIHEAGFYQVNLAGHASQLYTLEVIPDLPVDIHILSPQQYTTIEPGTAPLATLSVQLQDDYGIASAGIVATNASGKGESVSFKEQQLSFQVSFDGRAQMNLRKVLDLHALGLHAGDELYFYVKATDNRGQESRSDMYFISLPDTAELMSLSGMEAGISQMPEYFRSQRQIIIDIEKLLQQQASLPKDSFNLHSNLLGDDQKLLRLRYGKFIGEEWESGGHHPGDGHDHGEDEHEEEPKVAFGDAKAIEDQYAHKHDNAEDATYLEPAQKAQLKAILTEMWSSELKLRMYTPREALPYAYKALRLLKEMQQKSRAYVSKTSIKMPPLRPDKRLTGELDKIGSLQNNKHKVAADDKDKTLQQAMTLLEALKQWPVLTADQATVLLKVQGVISEQAVSAPADYLPALNAIRKIVQEPGKADKATIAQVQAALQRIIRAGSLLPQKGSSSGDQLSDYYFKHLSEG